MSDQETDIRTMLAGPEIDALIAERVFGWETHEFHDDDVKYDGIGGWRTRCKRCGHSGSFYDPSRPDVKPELSGPCRGDADGEDNLYVNYSTDIAAAWLVVEKMRELRWDCTVTVMTDWEYGCRFAPKGEFNTPRVQFKAAETAPLAICRAVLLALEENRTRVQ